MEKKKNIPTKNEDKILDAHHILESNANPLNKLLNKKQTPAKCFCTVKQFAYFVEGTESQQNNIIKKQKNPPEEPFFWYQTAQSSIRNSLLLNSTAPIYDGINKLKVSKPDGDQKKRNKELSILALEKYLKISLPVEFRELKKTAVVPTIKLYEHWGVGIKITPDLVFEAEYKGQKIIGAARVNLKKTKPFNNLRMRVVTHLIYKYLQKHVAKGDTIVAPEFCLCIDIFANKYAVASKGADAPIIPIKMACLAYAKKWDKI